jgi:predicted DNA-binding transcriptional regulator AlpA
MSKHYSGPVILRAIEAARLLGLDAAAFRQGIRDGWIPRPVPTISSRQQRWLKSELLAIARDPLRPAPMVTQLLTNDCQRPDSVTDRVSTVSTDGALHRGQCNPLI